MGIDTQVYLLNIEDNIKYIKKSIIPEIQIKEISSYKFKNDSDKRLLARTFLFEYLKEKYGITNFDLGLNEYKKPFLQLDPSINFSFSYAKNYVLVGISKKKIGVDIEHINTKLNINDIAQEIMCKQELDWFNSCKDTSLKRIYFFKLFSAKESIIKAFGMGLYFDAKNINTLDESRYTFKNMRFQHKELGLWMYEYSLSVCLEIDL
ncbi:4'-phosphopantetheinyl transferase superfamily protein [Flavobacterium pectinovorum]|uniref:4'-phosphopantetheinyl transferase family protein n=1 Tax=Flavobacterium pectinovorum TaxID=29533 RepID=UPI00265F494F|nr:4'-phosphopantetheinyl transferase superfamily protein [Flavobacterium pectinovorum]WKL50104.1 4'-phosphopantetheinyl transferase superfamily protein [Flavobacterium pectinovorum]